MIGIGMIFSAFATGAAIAGGGVYLIMRLQIAEKRVVIADVSARAATLGEAMVKVHKTAECRNDVIGVLARGKDRTIDYLQTLIFAHETLHAAASQGTIMGARRVISEGLERMRCMEPEMDGVDSEDPERTWDNAVAAMNAADADEGESE